MSYNRGVRFIYIKISAMSNKLLRSFINRKKFVNFTPVAVKFSIDKFLQNFKKDDKYNFLKYGKLTAMTLISFSLFAPKKDSKDENLIADSALKGEDKLHAGEKKSGLPTYSAEEVNKHNSRNDFWVTYKHGVYDVTRFLPSHPGGEQIYNAAGLSIEPFWNVYGMHNTPEIHELLESHRIGNLRDEDVVDHSDEELWVKEPVRDPRLLVKTLRPFNAEVPPQLQVESFFTPNEVFYVRQHMPVPDLDAVSHRLGVSVAVGKKNDKQFSLDDLNRYPRVKLTAAIMCAGNRRSEMNKVKPVKGLDWKSGAISNAEWCGVYLRDVLLDCGVDENDLDGKHVIFQGADVDATGTNFSTSIPLRMAMNPDSCIILATHMNGEELPKDHGYPLRVVVPGAPAVRSAKWLEKIIVSDQESSSHWHKKDYRAFNPSKTWETADFETAPPVYNLPVTSAICLPLDSETVRVNKGHIVIKGYAYSGGGAEVLRVDVSTDRGLTWHEASLTKDSAPPRRHYAWALWTTNLPVNKSDEQVEIWVKATDSNFNTQPENFAHIWNIRGILSNAYHKITVHLDHRKKWLK